jgi:hypothetical protein
MHISVFLFKLKQIINTLLIAAMLLPNLQALTPSTSSFYTEFEVSVPANSTLVADILLFVQQLCEAMPLLPCATNHNVTIAP